MSKVSNESEDGLRFGVGVLGGGKTGPFGRRWKLREVKARLATALRLIKHDKAYLRGLLFRIGVVLKGLDGVLEIAGGIALWFVSPGLITRVVWMLTQGEIMEDPHDLVANYLRHAVRRFSIGSEHFLALYLLGHGVVKIFIVAALLRNKLWAYPLGMVVFGGYVVYQLYLFTWNGSMGLIVLSILDLILIGLVWLEYRAVKSHRSAHVRRART
jgi:uncharacterized membrane protein